MEETIYTDESGRVLSHAELRKLLRKNQSPQYGWWSFKGKPRIGEGDVPRGVRTSMEISKMRKASAR